MPQVFASPARSKAYCDQRRHLALCSRRPGLPALVIEVACPTVRPAQYNREHSERHDEGCHKKHFSSGHDLLPLLPLPAEILPESRSVALIEIKFPESVDWDLATRSFFEACWLTQVNLTQSTLRQTSSQHRSGTTVQRERL